MLACGDGSIGFDFDFYQFNSFNAFVVYGFRLVLRFQCERLPVADARVESRQRNLTKNINERVEENIIKTNKFLLDLWMHFTSKRSTPLPLLSGLPLNLWRA